MTITPNGISRRHYLAAAGALLTAGLAGARPALAQTTIRQGYQTNLWGMPTYYLLRSGLLEKRGIKFEEFGVPSGKGWLTQIGKAEKGPYLSRDMATRVALTEALDIRREGGRARLLCAERWRRCAGRALPVRRIPRAAVGRDRTR